MEYSQLSFRDFIAISEGKNVGVIYHFTRISSLMNIIKHGFNLASHQDYISFTRNFEMVSKKYKNDLNAVIGDPRGVRIAIDGTKLSNKYKIQPYIDTKNGVTRDNAENEERVDGVVNILPYIVQIDIMGANEESLKEEIKLLNQNKIKINFIKTWTKVR